MFSRRWRILRVGGVPIYLSASWIWIALLYTTSIYLRISQDQGTSGPKAFGLSVLAALFFFGAVLVHEGAHAVMARALDLPVSGVTLVFWGGYTETNASRRGPRGEFLVSAAGPASTLLLGGVFWALSQVTHSTLSALFGYLGWINLIFAAFNALPGFPLDGGRVLLSAVWALTKSRRTGYRVAATGGVAVGVAVGAAGFISLRNNDGWAFFLFYVAFIMISTGRALLAQLPLRDFLARGRAADAMRPPPETLPADATLSHALDLYLRDNPDEAFPVIDGGNVTGMVSLRTARRAGGQDPLRTVREGMEPINLTPVVFADDTLDEVRDALNGRDGLVLRDGQLVGSISPGDIQRWFDAARQPVPPRPDR